MQDNPRRNILLIVIDQLRADCLGLELGGKEVLPNLNAFAAEAVTFTNHFSVVNPCGPSRTSLLTGLYAMNHRSVRNGAPLRDDLTNLARESRKLGYEPLLFGYTDTTADPRTRHPNDPDLRSYERVMDGFNEIIEMRQTFESYPWRAYLRRKGYALPPYDRFYAPSHHNPATGPRPDDPAFYTAADSDTAFLAGAFLDEIAVRQDEQWFAHLTLIRPHPPLIAPEPYNRMYAGAELPPLRRLPGREEEAALHPFMAADLDQNTIESATQGYVASLDNENVEDVDSLRRIYYGLATEVDDHIGRILRYLVETGLYDETLVVVTSDHGEMLGDRRQWGKLSCFDAAFHTPLLIRDPLRPGGHGRVVNAITESVDLTPTILDWIAGKSLGSMDGRSLLGLLAGENPSDWRDYAYAELDFGDPEVPTAWQRALGLELREANLAILRERRYKLVHFGGGLPPLLFDLASKEGELRNLANDPGHAGELLRLTQKLLSHRMKYADHTLSDIKVTERGVVIGPANL